MGGDEDNLVFLALEDRLTTYATTGFDNRKAYDAARRIQSRIRSGDTVVAVRVTKRV